jgi:pilus assembly protein CpaE
MADRPSPAASRRVTPLGVPSAAAIRPRVDGGMVIAVHGSRADLGVATVATALALAFRSLGMEDVGLAELDPRIAAARAAGVVTRETHEPRVARGTELAEDAAERILIPGADASVVKHQDGVWTLAMTRPRTTASDAKSVALMVDAMRDRFPVTVAALGHQINERTLAAFDAATRIVLITEGTVPSLRAAQRVLRLCSRLNYPDEKMCVVVNRFDAPGSLAIADIGAALRREVYWKIAAGAVADLSGLASKLLER